MSLFFSSLKVPLIWWVLAISFYESHLAKTLQTLKNAILVLVEKQADCTNCTACHNHKRRQPRIFYYLPDENDWNLQHQPDVSVLGRIEIQRAPSAIHHPAGQSWWNERTDAETEPAHHHFMNFQVSGQPLIRLAFPFFRLITSENVVCDLTKCKKREWGGGKKTFQIFAAISKKYNLGRLQL